MFAALTPDRKSLTLAVVNATESEEKFDLTVDGARLGGSPTLWQMSGSSLNAENRAGRPPQVEIKEIAVGDNPHSLSVAPISINVYRFPLTETAH